ncbi:hypothetical protein GO755_18555 [Spirosoma sp. HMF4905]|uniref:Uncharacterized protein n=1 Tax=Spirosoma arboris TaxID=2682092 RepID=A0A7K1SEC8_9BACT|nr:nucleotidyltransferase domain-containing protein [Spirosoma arboris]MVM32058.1 hypothetical protein [Spirosoma arboris]
MKIEKGQIIAGQPVLKVRDFFKRHERFCLDSITYFFAMSPEDANRFCSELIGLGYCEQIISDQIDPDFNEEVWHELLPLGRSLRLARAVPRISRQKADQILAEFMKRVEEVNCNEKYVHKITKVILFGSYIRPDSTDLGDVDIAVEITSKFNDPEVRRKKGQEYTRAAMKSGRHIGGFLEQLCFPESDLKVFLRNKSRYISLHPIDDEVLKETETLQIYPKSLITQLTDLLA